MDRASARYLDSKEKSHFSLCFFAVLGPVATLAPLALVFAESLSSGYLLGLVTLSALLMTLLFGSYGVIAAGSLFAIGITTIDTSLSAWSLWPALTSGAVLTHLGLSEWLNALKGGSQNEAPQPTPQRESSKPDPSLTKLLKLTRHQLHKSNAELATLKTECSHLRGRVKVADELFEGQNMQIFELFAALSELEMAKSQLAQLSSDEASLIQKACAHDQLSEQLGEKKQALVQMRRRMTELTIRAEAAERALEERVPETQVEQLGDQLNVALGRLAKARSENKELLSLVGAWSKA